MANKAILDVELNDQEFEQFSARFHKFQEEAKQATEIWSKGAGKDHAPQGFKEFFDELQNVTQGQQAANQNFRVTTGAWNSSIKHVKQFHHFISQSTFQLLKWTGLTSLFGSILSAGGLYGINRMAQNAFTMRQQAGGYGVTQGELVAMQTAFGRLGDMSGVLSGFSNALHDIQKRRPLVSLFGADYNKRTAGKDAAQVFVEALPDIKRKLDSLDERTFQLMTSNKGLGLEELGITPEMAQRIRHMKPEEIQQMINVYKQRKSQGVDDEVLKKWSDFSTKISRAGAKLESTFIHLFAPFTKGMERATSIFTFVLKVAFKLGEKAIALLKEFWNKFNDLFKGKGTEFAAHVKQFVAAARHIADIVLRFFGLDKPKPKTWGEVAKEMKQFKAPSTGQTGSTGGAIPGTTTPSQPPPPIPGTRKSPPKNATPWSPSSTGLAGTGGGTPADKSPSPVTPGSGAIRSTNGKPVPPEVLGKAVNLLKSGRNSGELQNFMASEGYPMDGNWCGEFAASVVHSAGGTPPPGAAVASNWLKWGQHVDPSDVHEGDIAVRRKSRYGGEAVPDQPGSHVGIVGDVDKDRRGFDLIAGNQGRAIIHHGSSEYEFRRPYPQNDNPRSNETRPQSGKSHTTSVQDNTGGAATVTHDTKQGAIQ